MKQVFPVAFILTLFSAILIFYKITVLGFPIIPTSVAKYWLVEAHLSFEALNKPVKAKIFVPRTQRRFLIVDESFVSRGYGLTMAEESSNRHAEWTLRKASGFQSLYYRALILRQEASDATPKKAPTVTPPTFDGAAREVALSVLEDARAKSADEGSLIHALFDVVNARYKKGGLKPLLPESPSRAERLRVISELLNEGGVPARTVWGLVLVTEARKLEPISRLEVYTNDRWELFTNEGAKVSDTELFFPWWRGMEHLANVTGGRNVRATIALRQIEEEAVVNVMRLNDKEGSFILWTSLLSLPLEIQAIFKILLLVPLGALVVVVLRNLIGIKMPGTFMPVLLALAFRETAIVGGVAVFIILTSTGLVVRSLLERLRLLLVPRVGGVLTVVVLLMAVVSVAATQLGFDLAHSVALFPMVVITMMIERTALLWEEMGPKDAFKQWLMGLVGSLIVYYTVMHQEVGMFLLMYPESLLIVLAALLLLGRYTGYRLLELKRFRALIPKS